MDEDKIQRAARKILGESLPREDLDKVMVYDMEQNERAHELYESAVSDKVNFAVTNEQGEVFVNTKWIGMVVRTSAEGMVLMRDVPAPLMTLVEVLGQTIIAADKFVGKR